MPPARPAAAPSSMRSSSRFSGRDRQAVRLILRTGGPDSGVDWQDPNQEDRHRARARRRARGGAHAASVAHGPHARAAVLDSACGGERSASHSGRFGCPVPRDALVSRCEPGLRRLTCRCAWRNTISARTCAGRSCWSSRRSPRSRGTRTTRARHRRCTGSASHRCRMLRIAPFA